MEQTIKVLRGADRVRCRPAVVFSDDGIEGVKEAFSQLLLYFSKPSLREITISQQPDHALCLELSGYGLELSTEDSWKTLFYELWEDSFYLSAVQYASAWMEVSTCCNGTKSHLSFQRGENTGFSQAPTQDPDDIRIRWLPDATVFREIALPEDFLQKKGQMLALLMPGVKVTVQTATLQVYHYPHGIAQYLRPLQTPIFTANLQAEGQERYNLTRYTATVRVGLCFCKDGGSILCYHGQRELTSHGSHITAILERIALYLQWDYDLPFDDESLLRHIKLVVLSDAPPEVVRWENGTRTAIVNTLIRDMCEDLFGSDFRYFLKQNAEELLPLLKEECL